jgi:hypothetical protein
MQLELQHASRVPLLRTPPRGFCSSSYKHATPNGVKTVNVFFSRLRWGVGILRKFRVLLSPSVMEVSNPYAPEV